MVLNSVLRPGNRLLLVVLSCALLILVPTWLVLHDSFDTSASHNALWAPGGVQTPAAVYKAPLTPEEQIAELVLHGGGFVSVGKSIKLILVARTGVIMPKLGNETVKAELGRASWKLLRKSGCRTKLCDCLDTYFTDTMAARFPEKPTESEKDAFKSFIYLFSRLYPCGECAAHFQELLRKHPPQVCRLLLIDSRTPS